MCAKLRTLPFTHSFRVDGVAGRQGVSVDKIDVIASCQADAEIIANALALLKEHQKNCRYYLNFENHKIVFAATLFAHVGGQGSY